MARPSQADIDKTVSGAMLLAFYGYLLRDQETIDIANIGLRAVGYPLLAPIQRGFSPKA